MVGFLASLFGGGAATAVTAIGSVVDELFTSDEERLSKNIIMERLKLQPALAQNAVNTAQAQHRSVFVAGARPFIMWVCGAALAYNFIFHNLLTWALAIWAPEVSAPAAMDTGLLTPVLLGMLGLGTLRTVEKAKGLAR